MVVEKRQPRQRTKPLAYWMNETPLYNNTGQIVAIASYEPERILPVFGIHWDRSYQTHSKVVFTAEKINIKVMLGESRKIYSSGVNFNKLREYCKNVRRCEVEIENQTHFERSKGHSVEITIKEEDRMTLECNSSVKVGADAAYEIVNPNSTRRYTISLTLRIKTG